MTALTRRSFVACAAVAGLSLLGLSGCGGTSTQPAQTTAESLVGIWFCEKNSESRYIFLNEDGSAQYCNPDKAFVSEGTWAVADGKGSLELDLGDSDAQPPFGMSLSGGKLSVAGASDWTKLDGYLAEQATLALDQAKS